MSSEGVDLKKRRFLTATTAVVGAVGVGFAAVPFIASWNPSERAKALGAPEEANISKLEPGALLRVKWRGKVTWVVRRTEQNIADLKTLEGKLADPN
jgi:ubiquinol-cytochrome c reductase iron-sulfur subunit